jgi:hypothetical protein
MHPLAYYLLAVAMVLSGCFPADGAGRQPADAGQPPDADVPGCSVSEELPVICSAGDACPVIASLDFSCSEQLSSAQVAVAPDATEYLLLRLILYPNSLSERIVPLLFSRSGGTAEHVQFETSGQAVVVVALEEEPLVISATPRGGPITASDGTTVGDTIFWDARVHATTDGAGRARVIYMASGGELALATRDEGGTWSEELVTEDWSSARLVPLGSEAYVIFTRDGAIYYQAPGEDPVNVTYSDSDSFRGAFSTASGDTAAPFVVFRRSRSSGHQHDLTTAFSVPDESGYQRASFGGLESSCPTSCGEDCQGSCLEAGVDTAGYQVVATDDGRVWVVYLEVRREIEVQLRRDENPILGCSCKHDEPTELRGERTLVLATLEPAPTLGDSPVLVERWRASLPEAERPIGLSAAAVASRVTVLISRSATGIRSFTIETAEL